jgi:4-hydroxymandelate oxidase/(S)-3,5-dihydroxyphenylglycine transaminase
MSELAATSTAAFLRKEDLHASLSAPVLDTMNFLNEITFRYPKAISFAPGRPYDGFFDTEQIFTHLRRYLDHLAEQSDSPEQIRAAMFQYGPTAGRIRDLIASSLRASRRAFATHLVSVVLVVVAAQRPGPRGPATNATPCAATAES